MSSIRADYASLQDQPDCEIAASEDIMLPMPDGVRLWTTCRRPVGNGPFPTIIQRSCYPDQDPMMEIHAEGYCRRGFAFVWQHCRGTGRSEGVWEPNINERRDGKTTIDWLDSRPWVESIGYWGNSYLALTGWCIADLVPPKVRTLYLTHYGTDRFTSAYQCGLFRQDVLTSWAMGNAGRPVQADYQASLRFRPQIDVDEQLWGVRLGWYRDWITSPTRDDEYWQRGFWKGLQEIPSRVRVPVYLGGGWYDHHLGSELRTWEALSPDSKKHSQLRVGAWNHGFRPCVQGTATEHLENSDTLNAYHWFDRLLRRKELPSGGVRVYQIGADRWLEEPAYPFPIRGERTFYLDSSAGAGLLLDQPALLHAQAGYTYDPENPVPSHGCESLLATIKENGSLPQPDVGWRDDVLSFISEPLAGPLEILGKIKVVLHVASTADDTAFSIKLMEIRADGKAYNLRSGITTLAYRQGSDTQPLPYEPGTPAEAIIECWDIAWKLADGSRLRLDISSSDFPQYAIHANYAGVWSRQAETRPAEQTLLTGSEYPSRLILPFRQADQTDPGFAGLAALAACSCR